MYYSVFVHFVQQVHFVYKQINNKQHKQNIKVAFSV